MKRKCKLFRCWIFIYKFYNGYLENHDRFITPNFFNQYQSSIKRSYLGHFPAKVQKRKKNTNSPRKKSHYISGNQEIFLGLILKKILCFRKWNSLLFDLNSQNLFLNRFLMFFPKKNRSEKVSYIFSKKAFIMFL